MPQLRQCRWGIGTGGLAAAAVVEAEEAEAGAGEAGPQPPGAVGVGEGAPEGQQARGRSGTRARGPPGPCGCRRRRAARRRPRCRCGCRSRAGPARGAAPRAHGSPPTPGAARVALPAQGGLVPSCGREQPGHAGRHRYPTALERPRPLLQDHRSAAPRSSASSVVAWSPSSRWPTSSCSTRSSSGSSPDGEGQFLGGGDAPNLPAIAAGTALVAGVMTILMGVVANYPLALATGLGLNAFVAFSIATQMTWADAMGLVVLEGVVILVLVLTGFREAVFHAVPAELKIAISVGIGLFIALIGFVDAGFVRRTQAPPGAGHPRSGRHPAGLAGAGVLLRPRPGGDPVGAEGARRDPHLDRGDHDRGDHRRGGRRHRSDRVGRHGQPARLEPQRPGLARRPLRLTRLRHRWASSTSSARSRRSGVIAALLFVFTPDARRLLRHDGHDDGHRRRGRPARRGRHAAQHPAHPDRRLRRCRRRWSRVASRRTPPTSSPPRASAKGPAPAWPRW